MENKNKWPCIENACKWKSVSFFCQNTVDITRAFHFFYLCWHNKGVSIFLFIPYTVARINFLLHRCIHVLSSKFQVLNCVLPAQVLYSPKIKYNNKNYKTSVFALSNSNVLLRLVSGYLTDTHHVHNLLLVIFISVIVISQLFISIVYIYIFLFKRWNIYVLLF